MKLEALQGNGRQNQIALILLLTLAIAILATSGSSEDLGPNKAMAQTEPGLEVRMITFGSKPEMIDVLQIEGLASENAVSTNVTPSSTGAPIVLKSPGGPKIGTFRVIRLVDSHRTLWLWRQDAMNKTTGFRRSGKIVILQDGAGVGEWTFKNAWPARYEVNATSGHTYEIVNFTYEDMARDR